MEEPSDNGINLIKMLRDYEKQLAHLKQEVAILTLQNKENSKSTKVKNLKILWINCMHMIVVCNSKIHNFNTCVYKKLENKNFLLQRDLFHFLFTKF